MLIRKDEKDVEMIPVFFLFKRRLTKEAMQKILVVTNEQIANLVN